MIKAIIFDLDGLLVETEPLHGKSWLEALQLYGISITEKEYCDHWVRDGKGIAELVEERKLKLDLDEARAEKRTRYHKLLQTDLRMCKHSYGLLDSLYEFPLALATASYRHDAEEIFSLTNIDRYFKHIITADDVSQTKPNPEAFLLAAQQLNIKPANALVLEDAEKGIIAAHKAGMYSIAVPTDYTRNNDFSLADKVVSNLGEVTLDLIASL